MEILSSPPASPEEGRVYVDTSYGTSGRTMRYEGGRWVYVPCRFEDVLSRIQFQMFRDWKIIVRADGSRRYLQVHGRGPCNDTGRIIDWTGRKWMLSEHMTDTEIVDAAYKALEAAMWHEFRENFYYRGTRIYDPHISVDALAHFA